jgi:HSP20 family molecular chaperone IbpA
MIRNNMNTTKRFYVDSVALSRVLQDVANLVTIYREMKSNNNKRKIEFDNLKDKVIKEEMINDELKDYINNNPYNTVIDMGSISELNERGWPIAMKKGHENSSHINVSFLGMYSSGKTSIINEILRIYEEVDKKEPQLWTNLKNLRGYYRKISGKTGLCITTKGISTLQVPRRLLTFIDSAGRGAPRKVMKNTSDNDKDKLIISLNDILSLEMLQDNVIIRVSDVVVFVIDRVTYDHQRLVLDGLSKIFGRNNNLRRTIIIIHNLKDSDYNEEYRDEQFSAFGVKKPNENEPQIYKSSWGNNQTIRHFCIWKDSGMKNGMGASIKNKKTLEEISILLRDATRARETYELNMLGELLYSIHEELPLVSKISPGKEGEKEIPGLQIIQSSGNVIKYVSKEITPLSWALREKPYSNEFNGLPTSLEKSDAKFEVKIEIPGLEKTNFGNSSIDDVNKSWFFIEQSEQNVSNFNVFGFKANDSIGTETIQQFNVKRYFGKFEISFTVGENYDKSKYSWDIKDGILTLVFSRIKIKPPGEQ